MSPAQAVAALKQWAKDTYGYDLTDQNIADIVRGIGYSGGPISTAMLEQAKNYAVSQAQQMGVLPAEAAAPAQTTTPAQTTPPASERGTPVAQPPQENTLSPDQAVQSLKEWARSQYGYELTDQNLADIVRGIGYTGGPITAQMLEQAKSYAVSQAQQMGLLPAPTQTTGTPTGQRGTPAPVPGPVQSGGGGQSAGGMSMNQARAALKQWAQSTYGYNLSDAQLQRIWEGINWQGGADLTQALEQAKQWATDHAQELVGMGGGESTDGAASAGGPTGGGPTGGGPTGGGPTGGGPTGGGPTGGGGQTAPADITYDPSILGEMQAWAIQTFGRPASQAELNDIAKAIGYTGGAFDRNKIDDWKHNAIIVAKNYGWKPTGPGELILPDYVEPELTGLPAAISFEQFTPPPSPEYGAFQGPEAFKYGEFVAPSKEAIFEDPGYQSRLREGQKALETSAASKGLLRTGATLKGLSQYGQELASQEYGKAFERQKAGYEENKSLAEKQWESAYKKALDEYQSGVSAKSAQWEAARQNARDMWESAQKAKQLGYETEYNRAMDMWKAASQKAKGEYESTKARRIGEYNAAIEKWKTLMDDQWRKAQLAAGKAVF